MVSVPKFRTAAIGSLERDIRVRLGWLYAACAALSGIAMLAGRAGPTAQAALACIPFALLLGSRRAVHAALAPLGGTSLAAQAALDGRHAHKRIPLDCAPKEIQPILGVANGALDRTEKVMRRQQRYFGELAEQSRAMLAVLQGHADALASGEANAALTADIVRLTRLIDQSVMLTRIRCGQFVPEDLDLAALVRGLVTQLMPLALTSGRRLGFSSGAEIVPVHGSPEVLGAAIRNLIENAIQHTSGGSEVSVVVEPGAIVSVADHGPGMPEHWAQEIFEPFWRRRDKTKGGVGLGLALAREATLVHHGRISARNLPGGGTIFAMILPEEGRQGETAAEMAEIGIDAAALSVPIALPGRVRTPSWRKALARLLHTNHDLDSLYLAAVVESSQDAVITKDLNGVITSWNGAAQRIFGYTPAEAVGQPVEMLLPFNRARECEEIRNRIRNGERIEHYETVRVHKDGREVSISLSVSPIRDRSGKVIGASKIVRDVTRHRQTGDELQEKAALLAAITDYAAEAIIVTDAEGRATFMNPAAERMTGWRLDQLRGKQLHAAFHYCHRDGTPFPASQCPLVRVYENGTPTTEFEDILIRKDDRIVEVAYSNAPITIGGEVTGAVMIIHDITARKKAEAALRENGRRVQAAI